MKRRVAAFVLILFALAIITGCNTLKGFGKDIKKAGEAIEDASD